MKVLIIKISSMGDIIHTLPAITDAIDAIPNIVFDWIIEETFSEIPTWHTSIHQIIPIKLRPLKKQWYKFRFWKEYYYCIQQLRKKKYDVIIDAQGLLKTSALIASFSKGIKHGMNYTSATEPISCWFYNKNYQINKNQHAIERIRKLFSYSLQYQLPSHRGQYNIRHTFKTPKIDKYHAPYLIFIYASTQLQKQWTKSNWIIIIQNAINAGYQIKLPYWTKQEELFVKHLKNHFNQIIILPNLTLSQIAMQMIQSTAILSIDTGLSHLAAAFNCPNLTLYGPTNPKLIGIYGSSNQIILQSQTNYMKHLNPNQVWEIFTKKLLCTS